MSGLKSRRTDKADPNRPSVEQLKRKLRESAERGRREREESRQSYEESEQRCSICRNPWPDDSYGCRTAVDEYDQAKCHVLVYLLCDECAARLGSHLRSWRKTGEVDEADPVRNQVDQQFAGQASLL